MFFFKSKKIVVDCFTNSDILYKLFPPKNAANYFPNWWKDLPKSYNSKEDLGINIERSTMKSCDGFIDLYKKGFMVPMWCDLQVEQHENGYKYVFSNDRELNQPLLQTVVEHDRRQTGGAFDNFSHAKILMPWAFKEQTGVEFLLLDPIWSSINRWKQATVPHGIVNFRYIRRPHVNTFFTKERVTTIINCGEPLVHFIPLSENKIDLRIHLVDTEEYMKIISISEYKFSFRRRQKNLIKTLKENKCPFV